MVCGDGLCIHIKEAKNLKVHNLNVLFSNNNYCESLLIVSVMV